MFFKQATNDEQRAWKEAAVIGFYVFLILLFIDSMYDITMGGSLLSSLTIFWAGLATSFLCQYVIVWRKKRKEKSS
ncbi:hypothetical protein [Alteribacter aurantiacus]|uniref:hypothetical protein n=1 Tax=Alteribacter aurantiacus TaxID=254410 RepID=UPI00042887E5|nr:hypothetical protein [Alteribacter aurantiacus]